ncbi:MAG TPA: DUF2959 family protein [Tepidisphaeraceae bacterium]|jgi:ElaB/YqjD/DUF883 family membrane-anchored ribosome-binding protein|nr:DUF2959 family protein [Tepidisphaeraceae bacterium]
MKTSKIRLACALAFAMFLSGCGSVIDFTKQEMGYPKRDILVSNVKTARNDEDSAKQQFQTTLQQFQAVTHFNGGDLEAEYDKLNFQYESCDARAQAVRDQIDRVEKSADKLFAEWNGELQQYSNEDLRRRSETELNTTKERYRKVITSMKNAAERMKPVLAAFKDQVLFLKHNLNAQAIASLSTTAAGIDTDVSKLIKEMEASIAEADTFVNQMKSSN